MLVEVQLDEVGHELKYVALSHLAELFGPSGQLQPLSEIPGARRASRAKPSSSSPREFHHVVGFVIVVPGIGSGNCAAARCAVRMCFTNFATFRSGCEQLAAGHSTPTTLFNSAFTILMGSHRSVSFEITAATSKASLHASWSRCVARFTSD